MFKKIKNFAHNHKDELIVVAKCAALVVGTVVLYSKSFDYGYNCRVNLEKSAGEDIFKAIENQN